MIRVEGEYIVTDQEVRVIGEEIPKLMIIPWQERKERTALEIHYRSALLDILKITESRAKSIPQFGETDESKTLEYIMVRLSSVADLF